MYSVTLTQGINKYRKKFDTVIIDLSTCVEDYDYQNNGMEENLGGDL